MRRVTAVWGGPERDALTLLVDPAPPNFGADPSDDDDRVVIYRLLDGSNEATGKAVGLEIDVYLIFDHWAALPTLAERWQLADWEPLPLVELLKRLQKALLVQTPAPMGLVKIKPCSHGQPPRYCST